MLDGVCLIYSKHAALLELEAYQILKRHKVGWHLQKGSGLWGSMHMVVLIIRIRGVQHAKISEEWYLVLHLYACVLSSSRNQGC